MNWYVLKTKAKQESRAITHLENQSFNVYCPWLIRKDGSREPLFTGYTRDGGYATHTLAEARYCFPLPERMDDAEVAPLLCAGLIGWRSYRMTGADEAGPASAQTLGLYGFGAAAHILAQVAAWQGRRIYAFTRGGDTAAQAFARSLGASWLAMNSTTGFFTDMLVSRRT